MKSHRTNTLFLDYQDELFAYLLGFLKSHEDAEDVLQDLYLKIWSKRKLINEETARYYFFSIARNLCIDYFRRKSRAEHLAFSIEYESSHDTNFEKQELTRLFRETVDKLPSIYREVIFLKDICQMETSEIVKITNLTANNVRVKLSRARAKVKDELEHIYNYTNIHRLKG